MKFTKEESSFVKGIAIWIMVLYHVLAIGRTDVVLCFNHFWELLSKVGNICVSLFAFISAYGLAVKLNKGKVSYIRFCYQRIMKLYHLYFLIFVITFLCYLTVQILCIPSGYPKGVTSVYGKGIKFLYHGLINMLGMTNLLYGDSVYTLNQTWWYMSLAIEIVVITPIINWLFTRVKWLVVILSIVAGIWIPNRYVEYIVIIAIGCCLAGKKIDEEERSRKIIKYLCYFTIVIGWLLYRIELNNEYNTIVDCIAAVPIIELLLCLFRVSKIVDKIGLFFGKHSGNIFYIHSLFYWYLPTRYFIYKLKYGVLVCATTMLLSVLFSIVLEKTLEVIRWDERFGKLYNRKNLMKTQDKMLRSV